MNQYRDFTFVCPTEILAFNDSLDAFAQLNTVVLSEYHAAIRSCRLLTNLPGVSTDSAYSHFAWANQPRKEGGLGPDLKLPLIADRNQKISRDYGVLIEEDGVALRGLFLIDPKGTLRYASASLCGVSALSDNGPIASRQITINDLPVGRSVEETIRLIKAFQFTDKYGEVCPANWNEGEKTMKADPAGSLEYFSAVNANAEAQANGTDGARKRARVE